MSVKGNLTGPSTSATQECQNNFRFVFMPIYVIPEEGAYNSIIFPGTGVSCLEDVAWSSSLSLLLCMKPCSKLMPLHQKECKPHHHQTAGSTGAQKEGSCRAHEEAPPCPSSADSAAVAKAAGSSCGPWRLPSWENKVSISRCEQDVCRQTCLLHHPTKKEAACACLLPVVRLLLLRHTLTRTHYSIQGVQCQEGLRGEPGGPLFLWIQEYLRR